MAAPEHVCHFIVRIHQSLADIYHENNHIGSIDGDLRLIPHLGKDHIPGIRLNASGINQGKIPVQPAGLGIDPVPGHPGSVFDNGNIGAGQLIEQSGFAHIRPADNRHNRLAHRSVCLLFLLLRPEWL